MTITKYLLFATLVFEATAQHNELFQMTDALRLLQQFNHHTYQTVTAISAQLGNIQTTVINQSIENVGYQKLTSAIVFSPETIVLYKKAHHAKADALAKLYKELVTPGTSILSIKTDVFKDQAIEYIIFIDSIFKPSYEIQASYATIFNQAAHAGITQLLMTPLNLQQSVFIPFAEQRGVEAIKAVYAFSHSSYNQSVRNITFMTDQKSLFKSLQDALLTVQSAHPGDALTVVLPQPHPLVLPPPNYSSNRSILPSQSVFTHSGLILPPPGKLANYEFKGASVLPYIERIDPITHQKKGYVLLGRETKSGLYNDFGGLKDSHETSLETAAREFGEETIDLVKNATDAKQHLQDNAKYIIVYMPYKFVIYVSAFSESELQNVQQNFYSARAAAKNWKYKEKDQLALIAWEDLVTTIRSAEREADGKFKVPILVNASVIKPTGISDEKIKLRRALVDALYSFVHLNKPKYNAEYPNILFY